jgi:hypothetical protein
VVGDRRRMIVRPRNSGPKTDNTCIVYTARQNLLSPPPARPLTSIHPFEFLDRRDETNMAAVVEDPPHFRATYNDVHNLIRASAQRIQAEFAPDMFIAIGARFLIFEYSPWAE